MQGLSKCRSHPFQFGGVPAREKQDGGIVRSFELEVGDSDRVPAPAVHADPAGLVGRDRVGLLAPRPGGFDEQAARARVKHDIRLSGIAGSLPADTRYLVIQCIEVTSAVLLAFADKADLAVATQMIGSRP